MFQHPLRSFMNFGGEGLATLNEWQPHYRQKRSVSLHVPYEVFSELRFLGEMRRRLSFLDDAEFISPLFWRNQMIDFCREGMWLLLPLLGATRTIPLKFWRRFLPYSIGCEGRYRQNGGSRSRYPYGVHIHTLHKARWWSKYPWRMKAFSSRPFSGGINLLIFPERGCLKLYLY